MLLMKNPARLCGSDLLVPTSQKPSLNGVINFMLRYLIVYVVFRLNSVLDVYVRFRLLLMTV